MPAPPLSRCSSWVIVVAATLTMAVSYIDRQTLSVLAPTVTAALHIGDRGYGLLSSAFSMAYLVAAPWAGRWIDVIGARRGLSRAVLAWSVVAALHTVVPGFAALFLLRVCLGIAEAPSFPGAAQVVHRVLSPANRARGLGVLFTGSSIGAMLAPSLAVALQHNFGWRLAFAGSSLCGLLWLPVWFHVTRSASIRAVLDSPDTDFFPAPPLARPARQSMSSIARDPAVRPAMILVLASAPGVSFMLLWGAKYLVCDFHLTQDEVPRYLWLPPLMFDLGAVLFGDLTARRLQRLHGAPDRVLVALAGVLATSFAFVPTLHGVWPSMFLGGVALVGAGGLYAVLTADMLARVSPERVSAAGGMTAAAQSLAYIVANPLIGLGVSHWGSYRHVLQGIGLWVAPGVIYWILSTPSSADAASAWRVSLRDARR